MLLPPESIDADYEALNAFVVNNPKLSKMESKIGGFNLFSVLGFEYGELRHSNALAWLFNPEESHGLQDSFLQRWLMTVLHEADTNHAITPVDVDCWNLASVEVRREWKHIDLLIYITMATGDTWVIAIENKVNSSQHSDQLTRYRKIVETEFSHCKQKLYLFLTKNDEIADDDNYLPASYSQIHSVLTQCRKASAHAIGDEPRVLIDNYLRLLAEKFMNESDIARLAQKIYKQHKRAIDIIVEQRPTNLKLHADSVRKLLEADASAIGIHMETSSNLFIRFTPHCWSREENNQGKAWGNCKRHVIFELLMGGATPELHIVAGMTPRAWITPLWEQAKSAPFIRTKGATTKCPNNWAHLHNSSPACYIDPLDFTNSSDIAQAIVAWVKESLTDPNTLEIVDIITAKLPDLAEAVALERN